MTPTLLAIDIGTQSVKALLFDLEGNPLAKTSVSLGPYRSEQPNWSEQDPEHFWKALCQACQLLWKQGPIDKKGILGIAITTQRNTLVNVDAKGIPLRPAITWMDNRRTEGLQPIGGLWGLLFKVTGLSEAIANLQASAKANWIRTYQPDIWQKTDKVLLLSGYLNFRLCGEFKDSIGSQVAYLPFDYKRHRWSPKSDWKWKLMPIEPERLPSLVQPGCIMGAITPEAAAETGLPQGLLLISAAADKACEMVGSGCIRTDQASLSLGTSATVNIPNQKYQELYHYLPPYPSAIPKAYINEYQIFKGFWMVEWFIREFGLMETKDKTIREQLELMLKERIPEIRACCSTPFGLRD